MRRATTRALALSAALLLVTALAVGVWLYPRHERVTRVSAVFPRTVSVYPGSDVRILGIPVGRVTSVTPEGTDVLVQLQYDARYKVPADARAVILSPSLIADRYVQLTPVYKGGPALRDGAEIPLQRTATPVELDRVFEALNQLEVALGPKGANSGGALSRALGTAASNLDGNGDQLHQTVADLSRAAATLAGNRQALFGTVRNLQAFISTLAASDRQVRTFDQRLASVAAQLAGERQELGAALRSLAIALGEVSSFVHDNRRRLSADLRGLADVLGVLVRQRDALAEVLDETPAALSNLHNAYNSAAGTLDVRLDVEQLRDPGLFLCSLLRSVGQRADCGKLQAAFAGLPPLSLPAAASVSIAEDSSLGGILGDGK